MAIVLYATYLYSSPDRRPNTIGPSRPQTPTFNDDDEERTYYDNDRIPVIAEKHS